MAARTPIVPGSPVGAAPARVPTETVAPSQGVAPGHVRARCVPWERIDDAQRAAWERMAMAPGGAAFLTPTYVAAVAAARPGRVGVILVEPVSGGDPIGFVPVQRAGGLEGRLGLHEPVGGEICDAFGMVAAAGTRLPGGGAALLGGAVPAILFTHLEEGQQVFGLDGGVPRVGLRTVIHAGVEAGTDHWAWLGERDRKLTKDTERRERQLERDVGPVRFEWQAEDAAAVFDWLVERKRAQYSRTGRHEAVLFDPAHVGTLRSLLAAHAPECRGTLSVLRAGERIVAAHFGLQHGDVLHVWFPVYDAELSRYSPGRLLFRQFLLQAPAHGVRVLDRGEGDTPAKRDFATEEHRYLRGLWTRGARGQLIRALLSLRWRIEARRAAAAAAAARPNPPPADGGASA